LAKCGPPSMQSITKPSPQTSKPNVRWTLGTWPAPLRNNRTSTDSSPKPRGTYTGVWFVFIAMEIVSMFAMLATLPVAEEKARIDMDAAAGTEPVILH
jgi:hypothetical protein